MAAWLFNEKIKQLMISFNRYISVFVLSSLSFVSCLNKPSTQVFQIPELGVYVHVNKTKESQTSTVCRYIGDIADSNIIKPYCILARISIQNNIKPIEELYLPMRTAEETSDDLWFSMYKGNRGIINKSDRFSILLPKEGFNFSNHEFLRVVIPIKDTLEYLLPDGQVKKQAPLCAQDITKAITHDGYDSKTEEKCYFNCIPKGIKNLFYIADDNELLNDLHLNCGSGVFMRSFVYKGSVFSFNEYIMRDALSSMPYSSGRFYLNSNYPNCIFYIGGGPFNNCVLTGRVALIITGHYSMLGIESKDRILFPWVEISYQPDSMNMTIKCEKDGA